jgi:hypothetical protein
LKNKLLLYRTIWVFALLSGISFVFIIKEIQAYKNFYIIQNKDMDFNDIISNIEDRETLLPPRGEEKVRSAAVEAFKESEV